SGSADGRFNSPSGLALDDNGMLYVADTDNHRIQILTLPTSGSGSSGSSSSKDVPDAPKSLSASAASPTSIIISWKAPELDDDVAKITGYKIESKEGSSSYKIIVADTKSTTTSFLHTGLDEDESYRYKVYAINSEGTSNPSFVGPVEPGPTQSPAGLTATAVSKNQIMLSWIPPTDTFNQAITGYLIEREVIPDILYDNVATVGSSSTTYTVSGLETGKEYSYVVTANLAVGNTPRSNSASATPETNSKPPTSSSAITLPTQPRNLSAVASSSQVQLTWNAPSSDGNSKITGYKIEVKKDSGSYSILESNTKSTSTSYVDSNVQINSKYIYRVSAINSVGTSIPSSEVPATPKSANIQISPIGKLTVDEGKFLSFTIKLTDNSVKDVVFSLDKNPPAGAKIISNTGMFSWTPSASDAGKSHTFDVVVKKDGLVDRETITITVNDIIDNSQPVEPKPTEPKPTESEPKELGIAPFVDKTKDPQSYVDRYNNEATYKKWFDENFPEYDSIYQAVGLEEPKVDDIEKPKVVEKKFGICGPGTKLIEGVCTIVVKPVVKPWWQFW
ncbi:MAG: fibronectin type III domain-containing protein, partial [Nitrosopumilus sp.]|nr:fibronectin type III domain-containing protein [Nitrosopumilus sp.]